MNKKTKFIVISVVTVIILLLLLLPKLSSSDSHSPMGGPGAAGPTPVKGHILKPEKLNNNVITTGTILANESVELKSEISGKVVKIFFKEGSRVNKGDILLKINDEELQAQLLRAKSNLKLSEENEARQKALFEKEGVSK